MTDAEVRREFAEEVVRRLRAAGYQSLWAGGCVRDLILGHPPSDYDVATDARPEQVTAVLPFRTIPVGISFGAGALISVLASIGPAYWAARREPVEAMRVEE